MHLRKDFWQGHITEQVKDLVTHWAIYLGPLTSLKSAFQQCANTHKRVKLLPSILAIFLGTILLPLESMEALPLTALEARLGL